MAYRVHLDNFEGPLDLLLYFIQRDQIDIYDIPISHITAEYLGYLEMMEVMNLSVAGEFILLAATLMHIKARLLLPRPEPTEDQLIEDPRQELVQQLIEYQRFRQAAEELGGLARQRRTYYPLGMAADVGELGTDAGDYLKDVTLFQLVSVFKQVIDRLPRDEALQVRPEPIKLDDCIRVIRKSLRVKGKVSFRKILESATHIQEVVITFLAVLEMVHRGMVAVRQPNPYDDIQLVSVPAA